MRYESARPYLSVCCGGGSCCWTFYCCRFAFVVLKKDHEARFCLDNLACVCKLLGRRVSDRTMQVAVAVSWIGGTTKRPDLMI